METICMAILALCLGGLLLGFTIILLTGMWFEFREMQAQHKAAMRRIRNRQKHSSNYDF